MPSRSVYENVTFTTVLLSYRMCLHIIFADFSLSRPVGTVRFTVLSVLVHLVWGIIRSYLGFPDYSQTFFFSALLLHRLNHNQRPWNVVLTVSKFAVTRTKKKHATTTKKPSNNSKVLKTAHCFHQGK